MTPLQPPCNVGDIIDYPFYEEDTIFIVFDCKDYPDSRQYHCYSLTTGEIYKFEFPCDKPTVLA